MSKNQDTRPIAYVEHPCTTEEKKSYNQQGFKVRDIRYAPEKLGEKDKKFPKPKGDKK